MKKPRLSLTTIGVLRIFCTKSIARASVSGEVFLPTMISTSGIFSTGEKKCRPMKWSGRDEASARPVIGRVEVLEANTASVGSAASAFLVASALTSRFSNTASITSWQSFSAPKSGVAVTLASSASRLVLVEPAALHQLVELVRDVRLALVGGGLVAIDQHDVEAGLHRDGGDARAHQAGAEHADLLVLLLRHALGPARELVGFLQAEEQRADHALGDGVAQQRDEVARLDACSAASNGSCRPS